jgi:hypothetical protein
LLELSEGGAGLDMPDAEIRLRGTRFARRTNLGYIVLNRTTAPPSLVRYAERAFRLERVAESGQYLLFRVHPDEGIEADRRIGSVADSPGYEEPAGTAAR